MGGSFDPVHLGHLGLAKEALERFHLDRVKFIPTYVSPHKQEQPITLSSHRQEMLRLAIQDNTSFELSDIELQRERVSYTIDTLNILKKDNPNTEFFLIMAVDTFQDLTTWKKYQRILEGFNLLIASRPGFFLNSAEEALRNLHKESIPYQLNLSAIDKTEYRRKDNGRSLSFFKLKEPKNISSRDK